MSNKSKVKDDEPITLSTLKKILDDRLGPLLENKLRTILNESLDERLGEMNEIKKEVDDLKDRMEKQEELSEGSEKYLRCSNLVFYGIPQQTGEDPLQKALDIIRAVNVEIEPRDLDTAHRLRTRSNAFPQPFIIRFVNRWKKDDVLAEFKNQQPMANRWGGDKRIRVYCNEQLTPRNQMLMFEAKKWGEFYSVWAYKGQIFCRKKLPNSEPVKILDTKAAQTLGGMLSEDEKQAIRQINQSQRRQNSRGSHSAYRSNGRGEGDTNNIPTQNGKKDDNASGQPDAGASSQPHGTGNK